MMRGIIDLLVEYPDGRLCIVDFKTTEFVKAADETQPDQQPSTAALAALCRSRSWDLQLAAYRRAVQALWPTAKVAAAVYFTSLRHLVFLDGP